jgi:hypothetical protein
MLLEQGAPLPLGHAAPHAELDSVVEGVSTTFGDYWAVAADNCRLSLGGATDE